MDKINSVIKKQNKFAIFPIVGADHCARLLNLNFPEVATDGKKLAKVLEYGYQLYKYDMVLVFSDPYVEAQALGCEIEFKPYPFLVTAKTNKRFNRTLVIIEAVEILKKRVDVPIFVSIKGPFSLASFLVGIDKFLRILLKDENEAKQVIDEALEFQQKYLEKLLSLNVNIFLGDPVASASVISPNTFQKYAYEPLRVLINKIRDKGLIAGIHICGETIPILNLLDSLNADILSIEDITPKTKTVKMGGVSTQTILNGTKAKIRSEVQMALEQAPIILSTSCDVPPETDPENIRELIKYGKK